MSDEYVRYTFVFPTRCFACVLTGSKIVIMFMCVSVCSHSFLVLGPKQSWSRTRQFCIGVIPHRTDDNNLGPDRLAGPKALDPNYCRQPTLCLKVLKVFSCICLGPRYSPYSYYSINVALLT